MDQPLPKPETLPSFIRRSLIPARECALAERGGTGWVCTSNTRALDRVEALACAIRDAGLQAGDRVALIAADSVDWLIADFAILFAACVVVPIFPTQAPDQVGFILRDSGAKLIFTDTPAAAAALRELNTALPRVVVFQSTGDDSLATFEARGAQLRAQDPAAATYDAALSPEDLAVLIYTSGTTGEPKGVMLTHHNLTFTTQSTFSRVKDVLMLETPVLSVLPFSHIYEHCMAYGYLMAGAQHYISHSVDELVQDLKDVRPVIVMAVPRIFERMIAVIAGRAMAEGGLRGRLIPWALGIGRDYMTAKTRGKSPSPLLSLQYAIARALVLRNIKPMLGLDRLAFFGSGSAPLHFDVAMTMRGCGIEIVEGYGPTECSPVITVNRHDENHYGTVGRPIPGVEIAIAEDGEIIARGENVMKGYYKHEDATAQAVRGGWYHTGDIGTIDADGYLRITDRKNELFKTSGGKFVAPSRVEAAIKRSVYVNQVMVVGAARPHPAALISPNWDLVRTELGLAEDIPISQLIDRGDVETLIRNEVRAHTADLATFEQVRLIALLPRELTIEQGELSPTLKVKRRVVEDRFAPLIETAYA